MSKEQIDEIINLLINEYNNFDMDNEKYSYWTKELSQYDYNDVIDRIKSLIGDTTYAMKGPTLSAITRKLTKKNDKVDFSKLTWYCQICNKAFNEYDLLKTHEDRCSSIRYIIKQCKKYNLGEINKAELYNLSQVEFDERYKKFLRKIQMLTANVQEKTLIENIFNPQTPSNAKAILGGM